MISVIVPLYNAEKYIKKTVESILAQSYSDFEIIICDDCSDDRSRSIVESFGDDRIRLISNKKNMGIAYTRNKCIDEAMGEFIALWDDDDLSPSYRFDRQIEAANRMNADIIIGNFMRIDADGNKIQPVINAKRNPKYLRAYQLLNNCIPNGTALIKRKFINDNHIRYRDHMYGAEDYRFWNECVINRAVFYTLNEVLLYYRVHDSNTSMIAMRYETEKRDQVIRDIQKYMLESTGYKLSNEQLNIIFKLFKEEPVSIESKEELQELYGVLCEIINQSIDMKMDNVSEIKDMCRIRFAEKVRKASVIWEIE